MLSLALLVAPHALAKTASEVFEIASRSTVVVLAQNAKEKTSRLGSGVVLADGAIVTNCHTLKGGGKLSVRHQQREYPAVIRHTDWDRDVCSLSVPGLKATPVTLGNTRRLKVGAHVYAVGAPKGLELTLSDGIVSSLRQIDGGQYIQTTTPISPGSSGGGLYDEQGRLLGLTTFYLAEGQNLNFALPVEWIEQLPERHVASQQDPTAFTDWLNRALALQDAKNWPEAIRHAQRWTLAMPNSSYSWFHLGVAYGDSGQPAKAIEPFQQVLRIDPEEAKTWFNLGLAYDETWQVAKAIEAYQQSSRIDPEEAKVWYNLGNAYVDAGQMAKAVESYQQALRIDPEHAEAWNNLGVAYGESGQLAKAIVAYQRALTLNTNHAKAWSNLCAIYANSDQFTQAIEACREALRIDPDYAQAWANLGVAYRLSGQRSKVIEVYRRLQSLDKALAESFFTKVIMP
ncbi:MAG TPA: tetratricopeptide repeat-containing serine protease family protein [Thiobacillaceae bacterium]|nr:tetratricopeptide repeat-containing serine protease family protein [Thiobacillaceae bacterium]